MLHPSVTYLDSAGRDYCTTLHTDRKLTKKALLELLKSKDKTAEKIVLVTWPEPRRGRPKGAKNKKPTKASTAVKVRKPQPKPQDLVYSQRRDDITAKLESQGLVCQEKARNGPRYQPPAKHEYRSADGARVIVWWEMPGHHAEHIREVWSNRGETFLPIQDIFPDSVPINYDFI